MEDKVNYTVVGLFVIILGTLMVIFFFWISMFRHEKTYNTYLVYFKEDVTGLSVQTPVRYSGVPVGYVKKIELDKNNPQLVRLNLQIEEGTPITTQTVATLQFQGITGVLYVGLKTKVPNAPPLKPVRGEKYPIIASQPSFIMQLSEVLPEIMTNIRVIGNGFKKFFSDKNQRAFSITLQNLSKASEHFPHSMANFNETITTINRTTSNISRQLVPPAYQLLDQLNTTISNLKSLSSDLERNPSILIRGRKPPPPGPGEK